MDKRKDYEICKRCNALSKIEKFVRKLFPKYHKDVSCECFVIKTNKTVDEIYEHYGGSDYIMGISECTRLKNQELSII